jgi:hypothetical protein
MTTTLVDTAGGAMQVENSNVHLPRSMKWLRWCCATGVVWTALVTSGCEKTLLVTAYRPGNVQLYGADEFVVGAGEGRRAAQDIVHDAMNRQVPPGFRVSDQSNNMTLVIAGDKMTVTGGKALNVDQMYVRADVVEWDVEIDEVESRLGNRPTLVKVRKAEVILQMTVANVNGDVTLNQREYRAEYFQDRSPGDRYQTSDDELLQFAAQQAVDQFYRDILPNRVNYTLRLDDSDAGQSNVMARYSSEPIGLVIRTLEEYVAKNPENGAGHYNLAVFLDADQKYDEAIKHYQKAMSLGPRDFYASTYAGCTERQRYYQLMHELPRGYKPPTPPTPTMPPTDTPAVLDPSS